MNKSKYDAWSEFHAANPHVYDLIEQFAFDVIRAGYRRFGMQSIIERVRWFTLMESEGDRFKINNNFEPYYARLFMARNPQHDGFFRTRKLKGN